MKKLLILIIFCSAISCQKEPQKPTIDKFTFELTGSTFAGMSRSGEWGVYGLKEVKQGFRFLSSTRVQRVLYEGNTIVDTKDTTYTLTIYDTGFTMFAFLPSLRVPARDCYPASEYSGYFTDANTLKIMGTTMTRQ